MADYSEVNSATKPSPGQAYEINSETREVQGVDGQGHYLRDTGQMTDPNTQITGLNTSVTREIVPELIHDEFDRRVLQCAFSAAPINAMTRDTGYRKTMSMRYGYWTVDLKDIEDTLADEVRIALVSQYDKVKPTSVTVNVTNGNIFDVTDQITFFNREQPVYGYVNGQPLAGLPLNARISEVDGNQLKVQFLNAGPGLVIPNGTSVFVLGHAASEIDASTVPQSVLPDKSEQFMQKFMVQSLVSSIQQEQSKEVDWEKDDIDQMLLQQFSEDIEKSYIWGIKGYVYDSKTRLYTYTTSGLIEQMLTHGAHYLTLSKAALARDENELINVMSEIFVGNSGSTTRYMYTGTEFATALFSTNSMKTLVANNYDEVFGYNYTRINLMGFVLKRIAHPMFDKMKYGRFAMVLDRQYVEKRVFRSMEETRLKLKEAGVYDGDSSVWCEISSIVLKYPKCHALLELVD